ncbi:MAG: hypothetical protein MUC87_11765 [Bacteroidia bacterium]|jgi:hypothetical protein|nr:hypothetical protein [Bacteroidia bacterium]
MENPFAEKHSIFNGQFILHTEDNEFRMSHWVKGFGIAAQSGEMILAMNSSYDLEKYEEAGNVLKVRFRIYPQESPFYEAGIDLFEKIFSYNGNEYPLDIFHEMFGKLGKENDL